MLKLPLTLTTMTVLALALPKVHATAMATWRMLSESVAVHVLLMQMLMAFVTT